jgi:beta-galactosidase
MRLPVTSRIAFGGDYNPEQWPEEVWERDYRLFDVARIDTVTLGVFAWALTQPAADTYDFSTLDRIVGRASAAGRNVSTCSRATCRTGWRRSPRVAARS